jgi:hypothetical protein
VTCSPRFQISFSTRRTLFPLFAGALLIMVGSASYANDHLHFSPEKRPPAVLFHSYPEPTYSAYAPERHVHRYVVRNTVNLSGPSYVLFDNYSILPGSGTGRRVQFGAKPGNPYSPAPSTLGGVQPGDDLPPDSDEWTFKANPLLNQNHQHERGATLSIRHDF